MGTAKVKTRGLVNHLIAAIGLVLNRSNATLKIVRICSHDGFGSAIRQRIKDGETTHAIQLGCIPDEQILRKLLINDLLRAGGLCEALNPKEYGCGD
jgi:hypothetical protein